MFVVNRFMVICHPMTSASRSTPERARVVILLSWIAAFVLAVPAAVTSVRVWGKFVLKQRLSHQWTLIYTLTLA